MGNTGLSEDSLDRPLEYFNIAFYVYWYYGVVYDYVGEELYKELLETWFPEKSKPPSAFLLDTSEEALLLPDWLKLRMIRSSAERLIDTGMFVFYYWSNSRAYICFILI